MDYVVTIPKDQLQKEKEYLRSSIFKLLPYKQENYPYLDNYFVSVIQKLDGFNKLIGYQPKMITIIGIVESARTESDFAKYRKAILDACSLINAVEGV